MSFVYSVQPTLGKKERSVGRNSFLTLPFAWTMCKRAVDSLRGPDGRLTWATKVGTVPTTNLLLYHGLLGGLLAQQVLIGIQMSPNQPLNGLF